MGSGGHTLRIAGARIVIGLMALSATGSARAQEAVDPWRAEASAPGESGETGTKSADSTSKPAPTAPLDLDRVDPATVSLDGDAAEASPLLALSSFVSEQRDSLGRSCDMRGVGDAEPHTFIACGEAGLWVVRTGSDGKFSLVDTRDLGGTVTEIFIHGGQLWARVSTETAHRIAPTASGAVAQMPAAVAAPKPAAPSPLRPSPRRPAQPAPAPPAPPLALPVGRVIDEPEPGLLIVELGSNHRIRRGIRMELFEDTGMKLSSGEVLRSHRVLAVGRVVGVWPHRSSVRLGMNEQVPIGALARPTGKPVTAGIVAPPRMSGLWEVEFFTRPFVPLGTVGIGTISEASVGYRGDFYHVFAGTHPLTLATAEVGKTAQMTGTVAVALDSKFFEAGLGLGFQTIDNPESGIDPGTGMAMPQFLRIGALDGLHLSSRVDVALFQKEFMLTGVDIGAQIALSRSAAWLIFRGGGSGPQGYAFGEAGVRIRLEGNGGSDSVFLTATAGGAGVFEDTCILDQTNGFVREVDCTSFEYAGPMVGFGMEWRL